MTTFSQPSSPTSGMAAYQLEGANRRKKRRAQTLGSTPATEKAMSQAKTLNLFVPITKIDVAQRLVYGVATAEVVDKSGEICDYASTKPFYQEWSDGFAKATDGKSLGNVRAMHGKIAAGKLTAINFNDTDKQVEICAKVVDDAEWNKVEEGVYTGFSQGGQYVKRWKDGDAWRYTAKPGEVSLVDDPCVGKATFQVIKDGGEVELRKFKTAEKVETPQVANDAVAAKAAEPEKPAESKPDDEVAKAALEGAQVWIHPSLPGKTFVKKAEMIAAVEQAAADKAATAATAPVLTKIAEIGAELDKRAPAKADDPKVEPDKKVEKTAEPDKKAEVVKAELPKIETVEELKAVIGKQELRRHLIKRAAALKAPGELPEGMVSVPELKKDGSASLYTVSSMLSLLASLESCEESIERNDYIYGWSTRVPKDICDRFGSLVVELGDIVARVLDAILAEMKAEEAAEALERSSAAGDLMKNGVPETGPADSRLEKMQTTLDKAVADRDAMSKALEALTPKLDDVLTRVKAIEAQPAAGGPAKAQPVFKGNDGVEYADGNAVIEAFAKLSDNDKALTLIKMAQQRVPAPAK